MANQGIKPDVIIRTLLNFIEPFGAARKKS